MEYFSGNLDKSCGRYFAITSFHCDPQNLRTFAIIIWSEVHIYVAGEDYKYFCIVLCEIIFGLIMNSWFEINLILKINTEFRFQNVLLLEELNNKMVNFKGKENIRIWKLIIYFYIFKENILSFLDNYDYWRIGITFFGLDLKINSLT